MKHFHITMAILTLFLVGYSGFCIINQKAIAKKLYAISHAVYFLLIASGLYLMWQLSQVVTPPAWLFAKMILVVAMISAMVKARRAVSQTPPKTNQAKAGLMIAAIALLGILYLAIVKPSLSFLM